MCEICDAFEAGDMGHGDATDDTCPECGAQWCSCFNCGANSVGGECPHCSEEEEEE